jgi:hypothetical protein
LDARSYAASETLPLILKHLMTVAREAGISLFDGEVRNQPMLTVFRSASASALPSF